MQSIEDFAARAEHVSVDVHVSMSSLEEVFLSVAEELPEEEDTYA